MVNSWFVTLFSINSDNVLLDEWTQAVLSEHVICVNMDHNHQSAVYRARRRRP